MGASGERAVDPVRCATVTPVRSIALSQRYRLPTEASGPSTQLEQPAGQADNATGRRLKTKIADDSVVPWEHTHYSRADSYKLVVISIRGEESDANSGLIHAKHT